MQSSDSIHCAPASGEGAFTLVEVMVVSTLVLLLVLASFNTILYINFTSHRIADTTQALSIAQAKIEEIRAATYNPPNAPFTAGTNFITNSESISLTKAGTNYNVTGNVISRIEPAAQGHLITVTATFTNANQALNPKISVTLQSFVNTFSGGNN